MPSNKWVVGFYFNNRNEVVLVLKTHPEWQAGKLNGVGGGVEEGETPLRAMQREFKEEAGAEITDWREFALFHVQDGDMHCFVAHGTGQIKSMTDEKVGWYRVEQVGELNVVDKVRFLIPMALDDGLKMAEVEYVTKRD